MLLLILSYSESRFWLNLSNAFVDGSDRFGQPILLGLFVFLAYTLGVVLVAARRNKSDWEQLTAESLAQENKELLGLILDYRSRSELLHGLSSAFTIYCGLGIYNLMVGAGSQIIAQPLEYSSSVSHLVLAVVFGSLFSWLLARYAALPFDDAKKLLEQFKAASRKSTP